MEVISGRSDQQVSAEHVSEACNQNSSMVLGLLKSHSTVTLPFSASVLNVANHKVILNFSYEMFRISPRGNFKSPKNTFCFSSITGKSLKNCSIFDLVYKKLL